MPQELKVLSFPKAVEPKKKKKKLRKYERADGRFCKYVTVHGVKKPIYGISTEDVEKKAREFKNLVSYGLHPNEYDITVREWSVQWFDAHMENRSVRHKTGVQRQLDLINSIIGNMKVREVREINLTKIVNSRSGMSVSQIDKIVNTIKRLFSSARQNHIIAIDPSMDLVKPKGTYEGHRALESWEINLLLDHYACAPAGLWAVTMMLSGLRREEIIALDRGSFDFDKNVIRVRDACTFVNGKSMRTGRTKTDAGIRDTPMLEPLTTIIRSSYEDHPRSLFATTVYGKELTESSYKRQWDTMLNRLTKIHSGYAPDKFPPKNRQARIEYDASLKPVRFTAHDLRYTYATILYDAGVDEKTAQRWLGHTSPEMTRDLYAKLTAERKARSDQNLNDYFKRFADKLSDKQFRINNGIIDNIDE